jgi:hypothetical protein
MIEVQDGDPLLDPLTNLRELRSPMTPPFTGNTLGTLRVKDKFMNPSISESK